MNDGMKQSQPSASAGADGREHRFRRRDVLLTGALGAGGLLSLGVLSACTSESSKRGDASGTAAAAESRGNTGFGAVPQHGPSRLVVWALAAIADWNLSYDVGFNDVCRFLGWRYKKVGMPQSQYSAQTVVQVISQAIELKPDILVTPNWVQGEKALLKQAKSAGIYVVSNNANNFPDALDELGIPAVTSNPSTLGEKSAQSLMATLSSANKRKGTILIGNPYPENPNQEGVARGAEAVIKAWNAQHGTQFDYVELADKSASNAAAAVGLWGAKVTQLGDKFVAGFAVADSSTQAAVKAFQDAGYKPGQYPLAAVDVTDKSLQEVESGWVNCVVDAGFYRQGWLPAMLAWQQLERGFSTSGAVDATGAAITAKELKQARSANAQQAALGKSYGVSLTG